MLKFVYKICPVIVKYVDTPPKGFAGYSYGWLVEIKKSHKDDAGLLAHELTHSRQFYRTLGFWGLLYKSKKRRYKYELEAYRVQLSFAVGDERVRLADKFAGFMIDNYDLNIDRAATKAALLKGLNK